jgi:hypothetical protein
MGMWRDLVYEWTITTSNTYFSLPEHSESLLGAMVDNAPSEIKAVWHDYRIQGYTNEGPSPLFGVVDDGWSVIREDLLTGDSDDYEIELRPVSPATALPNIGEVSISFTIRDESDFEEDFEMAGQSTATSSRSTVTEISEIQFSGLNEAIDVYAIHQNGGTDIKLATIKGDGITRYRRFRLYNADGTVKSVKTLLKRAWQPVFNDDDVVYLGNLNAIKHGLLGMLAEDNADLQRAEYHWRVCEKLLNEEMDATRGAAKPKLRLKPDGGSFAVTNIM